MPGYTVISDVGKEIVKILREYMVPSVISHEEAIGLCSPSEKGDYSLGVFLYDIRECESIFKNGMGGGGRNHQKYPSSYLSLYYMITAYSLSNVKFRSLQEHLILGKVIQVLKDYGYLLSNSFRGSMEDINYSAKMEMLRTDIDEKIKLRNMYDPTGRLSLYYKVSPVELESTRIKKIHRVTSVDMRFKNINRR